jgi:hypothetical protein
METSRTIPAKGMLFGSVAGVFNAAPGFWAYVVAEVTDGPGAIGCAVVQQDNPATAFALNAQFGQSFTEAFSAQLANGPQIGTFFKFINTGTGARTIRMTALDESGKTIASASVRLNPGQQFDEEAGILFDLGFTSLTVGSVRVTADGDGVLGDVIFGEPYDLAFMAALPLQAAGFTEALFSQVVNGAGYWTGLAVHNPNSQSADVTLSVHSPAGIQTGQTRITMAPGSRLSKLLPELVPSTQGQLSGYLVVRSSLPLIAQELFGDSNQTMLSAVPPVIVK